MSAPQVKLPMIGDVAWQAAFVRRHGLSPVTARRGTSLTPVEIAVRGANAAAAGHLALAQSLLASDRDTALDHFAQAEKAQQLAVCWENGTACYVPGLHGAFYEAGRDALSVKGGAA